MTKKDELEPCPHCEKTKAEIQRYSTGPGGLDINWFHVTCLHCGFTSEADLTEKLAIKRWEQSDDKNTRPAIDVEAIKEETKQALIKSSPYHPPGIPLRESEEKCIEWVIDHLAPRFTLRTKEDAKKWCAHIIQSDGDHTDTVCVKCGYDTAEQPTGDNKEAFECLKNQTQKG